MTPPSIESQLHGVAALVALVIAIALPATSYLNGRNAETAVLATEARFLAENVTGFVTASPLLWKFQVERVRYLLQNHDLKDRAIELVAPDNTVLASNKVDIAPPAFVARHPVYDYGREVATIIIHGSQRALLIETGWVGLSGLLIAAIVYFPLRLIPMRALRRSQQELEALNAELEQRVQKRNAELAATNKELETFTYSVAHDLKAPLRGINGYSQLLLEKCAGKLDGQEQDYLRKVREATATMNQLIEDLLTWTCAERDALHMAPVDVQALIREMLAECAEEIKARRIAVNIQLPFAVLNADQKGLVMVLRNLLGNALKFTCEAAQPVIEIGGRDDGRSCVLWVRDNGIGFDMRYHDKIFDIFERLHRAEEYTGTGVGLAIVKKALERMGGRVWAESTPGKGAVFYLELPK